MFFLTASNLYFCYVFFRIWIIRNLWAVFDEAVVFLVIIQIILDLMEGRYSFVLIPFNEVLFELISGHQLFIGLIHGIDRILIFQIGGENIVLVYFLMNLARLKLLCFVVLYVQIWVS